MNRTFAIRAAALISFGLTACNQTPAPATSTGSNSDRDADLKAIRDIESQWNQDFAAKDADKLTAHYADDAVLMTPGMAAAVGKDAIQKGLQTVLTDPAFTLTFRADKVDVAGSGDLAYTRGRYVLTMTDPQTKKPMKDNGSYVTDYRKQADGSWKAVADIASSEVLAEPAPPAKKKR